MLKAWDSGIIGSVQRQKKPKRQKEEEEGPRDLYHLYLHQVLEGQNFENRLNFCE